MTERITESKNQQLPVPAPDSVFRVGSIAVLYVLMSLMVRIPGPIEPLPDISIGGTVVGISNVYVFVLTGLTGLYLVLTAIAGDSTEVLVPRSTKYVCLVCLAIAVSAVANATIGTTVVTEIIQWAGLALIAGLVANFLQSEAELLLLLWGLVLISTVKAAVVTFNLLVFGIPISSYGTVVMGIGLLTVLSSVLDTGVTRKRIAAALLLIFPIALSSNRKGIFAFLLAFLAMRAWRQFDTDEKKSTTAAWPALGLAIANAILLLILVPALRAEAFQALKPILVPLSEPRYYLYQTGFEMFAENPLFGVGPDNWHAAKSLYSTAGLEAIEGSKDWGAHSYYLKILSELGLAGFVPFILLVMLPFKQASYFVTRSQLNHDLWGLVFAFSVYFSTIALLSSISKPTQTGWFLTFGLAAALATLSKEGTQQ